MFDAGHEVPDVLSDERAVLIHGQPEDLSILGSPRISEVGQRDHVAAVPSQPAWWDDICGEAFRGSRVVATYHRFKVPYRRRRSTVVTTVHWRGR